MKKSTTVLAMTAAAALLISTAAHADPKFYFRYVSGGANTGFSEPEKPTEPEAPKPEEKGVLNISGGFLSHADYNGNGLIDAGDHVTAQWTLKNAGKGEVRGISSAATFLIEDRELGGIVWSSSSTPLSCADSLSPGASMTCSASIVVTNGMLPSSRSKTYLSAQFGMNMPENVDDITGDSGIDSIPLGAEMLVEISGWPNVFETPYQLRLGDRFSVEFDLQSANGEPFSEYAFDVQIPELNATVPASCGNTSSPDWSGRCTATIALTPGHRTTLFSGFPESYSLSYQIIQKQMGGYPTNKKMAENVFMEGSMPYGYEQLNLVAFTLTAPPTLDGDFEISAVINNDSNEYLRSWEFDVDLGLDIKFKNICPNNTNFTPTQLVNCKSTLKLTEAQKSTIKNFFTSTTSETLNYSVVMGKENGFESGVQVGRYGSFVISW